MLEQEIIHPDTPTALRADVVRAMANDEFGAWSELDAWQSNYTAGPWGALRDAHPDADIAYSITPAGPTGGRGTWYRNPNWGPVSIGANTSDEVLIKIMQILESQFSDAELYAHVFYGGEQDVTWEIDENGYSVAIPGTGAAKDGPTGASLGVRMISPAHIVPPVDKLYIAPHRHALQDGARDADGNMRSAQAVIERGTPVPLVLRRGDLAVFSNLTYHCSPTTVLMPDGRTIFCAFSYEHGGRCGPLAKSADGGLTWSGLLPVPDNWGTVQNCPTIYRLTDPHGTSRLLVFAGRAGTQLRPGPENTMHQAHSGDDDRIWTPMATNGLECVMPFCSILPIDGGARLLGITNIRRDEDPNNRKPMTPSGHVGNRIAQSVSSDGGLTWSRWRITLDFPPRIPGEPELIRSPDGRQLLCLLRDNTGRWEYTSRSLFITSDDEGETWSEPRELPLGLTGDRHRHRHSRDGRLLVTMRNTAPGCPDSATCRCGSAPATTSWPGARGSTGCAC